MKYSILFLIGFAKIVSESKVFQRCELARELVKSHGFSCSDISDWICLVQSESSYNTKAIHKNTDGSVDYGLFQVCSKVTQRHLITEFY